MIEVWAPRAPRVRLRRPGHEDLELVPRERGWWQAEVELAHGDAYGFVLGDAEDSRPDPRSRHQPNGVHELSAVFDPARFAWTDQGWTGRQLAGGLIYELHVGTFTPEGTLDAAAGRLGHLVSLGVTHIELMPVNGFNGVWNWGYDGVAWYAVHEAYGGPAAYQRFVDAAHAAGLAVIQDVVYNHLGPSGNYLPEFGPYLRDATSNTWGLSVNLDVAEVRSYIIDNAMMWLRDYHVDGLRLDAVHALHDEAPVHVLQQLAEASDALSAHLGRPLTLIAESDLNDPTLILPREAGGYGLGAQWSDDYHHAVHVALTGETVGYYADFADLGALPKVWTEGFFHNGTFSSFRGRDHGFPIPSSVPTWRLVTFGQDHDQIGNRAAGDRLSQSLSTDRLAVAAVLTMLTPGTPMLFMGEEWGASTPWQFFTSHPEPELGEATARGRIEEFARMGWDRALVPDPQDPETFRRSILRWDEASTTPADGVDHARLLKLYRDLATLRRFRPELTDPAFAACEALSGDDGGDDPAQRWYVLQRAQLTILVNLTAQARTFPVPEGSGVVLSTREHAADSAHDAATALRHPHPGAAAFVTVGPDAAVVVVQPPGA